MLALATLIVAVPGSASATTVAQPADSFVDSIGLNVHTHYSNTPYYSEFETVEQRLRELGVRHVREALVLDRPDQYERLRSLAAAGIRSTLILGDPAYGGSNGLEELKQVLATELRGAVDAVEGPNEWDLRGGPGWMTTLAPYQARLYSMIKSDPALSSLPVLGPSLGNTGSDGGDMSAAMDLGNIHSYPNAEPPEWNVSRLLGVGARTAASKPVQATETGYHNALNWYQDHNPTSEAATAIYMPRLFLEYYRRGIVRTFSYELLDPFPNPGSDERELHFGLLRNDLSPKPAFDSLRNLISILADPGTPIAPGSVDFSVEGDQEDLHQLLLQKRDGSFYLALWRAASVWDAESRQPEQAVARRLEISFEQPLLSAEELVPTASAQPLRALPVSDGSLSLSVGPEVKIVRFLPGGRPAGGAFGRIKLWLSKRAISPGELVAVKGRVPSAARLGSERVKVQRWVDRRWATVAKTRTRANGRFEKRVRIRPGRRAGRLRFRVVAERAQPSNQVKVRIVGARRGAAASAAGIDSARALGPRP